MNLVKALRVRHADQGLQHHVMMTVLGSQGRPSGKFTWSLGMHTYTVLPTYLHHCLHVATAVRVPARLASERCPPACRIQVRGTDIPKPVKTWTQCGINVKVLEVLRKHGFERPLSIQAQVCT
jgi:hypothetical protein